MLTYFLCLFQGGGSESDPDVGQLRDPSGEVHRSVCESGQLPPLHRIHPQRQEEGRDPGRDDQGTHTHSHIPTEEEEVNCVWWDDFRSYHGNRGAVK